MTDSTTLETISNAFRVAVSRIDQLKSLGYTRDEIHRLVVPRRTLERRIADGALLSLEESDRVNRLQTVAERTLRVFSDPQKAQRWLRAPNRALSGSRPIDLLISETGARQVEEILGRIQYGLYS